MVAAIACSGYTNHLSSQPINNNQSLVRPKDEIPMDTITGKMLNVYAEKGQCTLETSNVELVLLVTELFDNIL